MNAGINSGGSKNCHGDGHGHNLSHGSGLNSKKSGEGDQALAGRVGQMLKGSSVLSKNGGNVTELLRRMNTNSTKSSSSHMLPIHIKDIDVTPASSRNGFASSSRDNNNSRDQIASKIVGKSTSFEKAKITSKMVGKSKGSNSKTEKTWTGWFKRKSAGGWNYAREFLYFDMLSETFADLSSVSAMLPVLTVFFSLWVGVQVTESTSFGLYVAAIVGFAWVVLSFLLLFDNWVVSGQSKSQTLDDAENLFVALEALDESNKHFEEKKRQLIEFAIRMSWESLALYVFSIW